MKRLFVVGAVLFTWFGTLCAGEQVVSYGPGYGPDNCPPVEDPGYQFKNRDGKRTIVDKDGKTFIGNNVGENTRLNGENIGHNSNTEATADNKYPGDMGCSTVPADLGCGVEGEVTIHWWDVVDASGVNFDADWKVNVFFISKTLRNAGDRDKADATDSIIVPVKAGTKQRVEHTFKTKLKQGNSGALIMSMSSNTAIAPDNTPPTIQTRDLQPTPAGESHKIIGYSQKSGFFNKLFHKKDLCVGVVEAVGMFTVYNEQRVFKDGVVTYDVDVRNDSDVVIKRKVYFSVTLNAGLLSRSLGSFTTDLIEFKPREVKHLTQKIETEKGLNLNSQEVPKNTYVYDAMVVD